MPLMHTAKPIEVIVPSAKDKDIVELYITVDEGATHNYDIVEGTIIGLTQGTYVVEIFLIESNMNYSIKKYIYVIADGVSPTKFGFSFETPYLVNELEICMYTLL